MVRNSRRLGLIKARMAGSDKAQGDVILFLDAHCEVMAGWLEPMLQRIKDDYRNVVMPCHDNINKDGFDLITSRTVDSQGTFNWGLVHTWQFLSDQDKKIIKSQTDPVKSPTMAGGLFAISRKWWEHLGKYDPGFEVWGGENLEISFKTWMCGGRLDIMPCSHVGHVFRGGHAKKGHVENSMQINQKRLAEVWLDEYKDIVYLRHPYLKDVHSGDITDRVKLRDRLKCNSFDWFMKSVHPDKQVPTIKVKARNGLINSENHCVDTMQVDFGPGKIYPYCHYRDSQNFQLTESDQLRAEVDSCLEGDINQLKTVLAVCSDSLTQKWFHSGPRQPIRFGADQTLCMSFKNDDVILAKCDPDDGKQMWLFKDYVTL